MVTLLMLAGLTVTGWLLTAALIRWHRDAGKRRRQAWKAFETAMDVYRAGPNAETLSAVKQAHRRLVGLAVRPEDTCENCGNPLTVADGARLCCGCERALSGVGA